MREQDTAETKDLEWEPTEEDREEADRDFEVLAAFYDEGGAIGLSDLEEIDPLWVWRRRAATPLTASDFDDDSHESGRRRESWICAQLMAATEGMPQPARRRMTLAKLSPAQYRAVWLPRIVMTHLGSRVGTPQDVADAWQSPSEENGERA